MEPKAHMRYFEDIKRAMINKDPNHLKAWVGSLRKCMADPHKYMPDQYDAIYICLLKARIKKIKKATET